MGRREKKLEKKKAKRTEKKREVTRFAAMGLHGQMKRAAHGPLLHCALHDEGGESKGMTQLLFSRRLPEGSVALTVVLVDFWCLGIKNVTVDVVPMQRYRDFHDRLQREMPGVPLDPPSARRLVEDAIAYALKYGLPPHRDTAKALPIFGDIDASAAARTFEFGKDGKPFYVAGPRDSISRQKQIVETLRQTAGEGNFHFTIAASNLADFGLDEDVLRDVLDHDDNPALTESDFVDSDDEELTETSEGLVTPRQSDAD